MSLDGTNLTTAIIASMHKAASTFLAGNFALVAQSMYRGLRVVDYGKSILQGAAIEEMPLPPKGVLAIRVYPEMFDEIVEDPLHPIGRFTDKNIVMVTRDPRDVAVSLYYSTAFSHTVPPRDAAQFLSLRAQLQGMSVQDGIRRHTAASAIDEFKRCMALLRRCPHALNAPYELLVTDFTAWFQMVVTYLGWHPGLVQHVGPALALDVQPPAVSDPYQHKRRVKPGNWRELFEDDMVRMFDDEIGSEMRQAGYPTGVSRYHTHSDPVASL